MSADDIGIQTYPVGIQLVASLPVKDHDIPGVFELKEGEAFDSSVMRINVDPEELYQNVFVNIRAKFPQMSLFSDNPQHIAIVGGGWSLTEPRVYQELVDLYHSGVKLIALNGSAKWLMERNLRPSMHVILDARQDNVQFIPDIPIPNCKVFLASQVHPDLFEKAQDRETYIFHVLPEGSVKESAILDDYYCKDRWIRVPACSSVGVTSILLCRLLGFRFQHLFGIDSCYRPDGVHHAYPQAMNEKEGSALFQVGKDGATFRCSAWQAAQAKSFLNMIQVNKDLFSLEIHGDGLLAYLLQKAFSKK